MGTHNVPKNGTYNGNICAFCHYWEGIAQLHSCGSTRVEYDNQARGRCLKTNSTKIASNFACPKFEMSNEASRYAK